MNVLMFSFSRNIIFLGPFSPVSKNSGNFQFGNEYLRTESSLVPTLGMPRKSLGISLSAGAEAAFNRATTVSRPMQGRSVLNVIIIFHSIGHVRLLLGC